MMKRLYYTDSLLRAFDATVVSCEMRDGRPEVVLDQTAFYPTSGGQPFDTGTLGGQRVIEVVDREDGEIVHVLETPGSEGPGLPTPGALDLQVRGGFDLQVGGRVRGEIDWPRRLDHMQQHTGQHILSAAFDRLFGVRTVSFHMSADSATIDLARAVTAVEVARAEDEANHVVWDDRPVGVRFADAAEAAALPLRKESAREGELRLVTIPDCDLSACGGTHVPRTGVVGIIAVAGSERLRGGSRLTFVCGGRALRSHRRRRDLSDAAARLLSSPIEELPAAIGRLQADVKASVKAVAQLEEDLSRYRAGELLAAAETIGPLRVVLTHQPEADANGLKRLAGEIVRAPGVVVILTGGGQPTPVVAARSTDAAFDAGAWVNKATSELGGRGGGRPEQAQGGIPEPPQKILNFARASMGNS